jgi:hypothetical protein
MEARAMAEEHSDIFHCLKCGRIAYEPHGTTPPPACCSQPMVRAVAHVTQGAVSQEGPRSDADEAEVATLSETEVEEYALLAEAMELSHWSRSFPDADVARYEELAHRVSSLAGAVADHFHNEDRAAELAKAIAGDATQRAAAQRLHEDEQPLLASFALLVDDLSHGPLRFHGWAEVCDRLDALASTFRRHEEAESNLLRSLISSGRRD